MLIWIVVCAVALVVILYAEARGKTMPSEARSPFATRVNAVAKPIASASFVAAAVMAGAQQSRGGQALLIALVWSFLGDILLIPRSRTAFAFGMAAFAMAHLGYAFFFDMRGVDWLWVVLGGVAAGAAGAAFFIRLRPSIRKKAPTLLTPVGAYVAVITVMVAFAIGTVALSWNPLPLVGALAFWLSDLTVALVRFTDAGLAWRRIGLPLYYAAQFTFIAMLPGA
ncbi:MAG: lysoplasmalogenase family protein [Myxococcota bacterium]